MGGHKGRIGRESVPGAIRMNELTGECTAGFEGDIWSIDIFDGTIELCVRGTGPNDEHRIALDIDGMSTLDRMIGELYREKMEFIMRDATDEELKKITKMLDEAPPMIFSEEMKR